LRILKAYAQKGKGEISMLQNIAMGVKACYSKCSRKERIKALGI
jgi:hypothetical protein